MATSFVFILNCRRHGHAFNLPGYCIREIHGCPEKSASKCRQTCSLFDKGNGIYRWGRQRTPKRLSPSQGRKRDALPHGTHKSLPCAKGGGSAFGAPAKPSVSGFAGERRSSGATALSALKAKRGIWSLRQWGPRRSPASAGSGNGRYAPKPPLCKGRCRPYRAAEGLMLGSNLLLGTARLFGSS